MSLDAACTLCGKELMVPGAVLLSPPAGSVDGTVDHVIKYHICVICFLSVRNFITKSRNQHYSLRDGK